MTLKEIFNVWYRVIRVVVENNDPDMWKGLLESTFFFFFLNIILHMIFYILVNNMVYVDCVLQMT